MVKNKGWTNTLYWYKYLHLSHIIVDNGVIVDDFDDLILVFMKGINHRSNLELWQKKTNSRLGT